MKWSTTALNTLIGLIAAGIVALSGGGQALCTAVGLIVFHVWQATAYLNLERKHDA